MTDHPSFGTVVKVDFAGGSSYTAIGQITSDITPVSPSRGVIVVTAHDDTWATKVPGIPDAGQMSFTVSYDPSDAIHEDFVTEFDADACTLPTWEITMHMCTAAVTSAVWTFAGFISGAALSSPLEGVHQMALTIEISGEPTLTIVTP